MANTEDLKSSDESLVGSSPTSGTNLEIAEKIVQDWEKEEDISLRDGFAFSLTRLIIAALDAKDRR